MIKTIYVFCGAMLIVLPLLAGCGASRKPIEGNRTAVTGVVTLDGTPLKGGSIAFVSVKDPLLGVSTPIRSDGTFSVENAPAGEVRVGVQTEFLRTGAPVAYVPIPSKYEKVETSGLTATIVKDQPDAPKLTIELKSK
jgi:hypothetical protein